MYSEFLSERIGKLRTLKGVSARDMSLEIGQNKNYINGIENGRTLPSMQGFFYICEYFTITPEEFFSNSTNPSQINDIIFKMETLNNDDLKLISSFVDRLQSQK